MKEEKRKGTAIAIWFQKPPRAGRESAPGLPPVRIGLDPPGFGGAGRGAGGFGGAGGVAVFTPSGGRL